MAMVFAGINSGCIPPTMSSDITPGYGETNPILEQTATPDSLPSVFKVKYFIPPYYSISYPDVIEASKIERRLVIYSTLNESAWKPVIEAFNSHYPWIDVTTVDLGATEVFARYDADVLSGGGNADMILAYAPDGWLAFANAGQIEPYLSEEDFFIPPWAKLAPGIYTIASDPMVIVYNKGAFSTPPQSMADIADLVGSDPASMAGKIATYDAAQNSTGLAINWFWIGKFGDKGWEILRKIGSGQPSLKSSSSSLVASILGGESDVGYFISPISFFREMELHPELGWSYIHDGQPVLMRSIVITRQAQNPNSSKLMIDFLLSQEGQIALAMGGLTPYRADIANVEIGDSPEESKPYIHFNQVIEEVGLDNLIFISLDPEIMNLDKRNMFIEKWNQTIGK
jgi:iron(III) transport system substrate-binding protein